MASALLATQSLISFLEDYSMVMILPKGLPMLQSMATKNWTWVDNIFTATGIQERVVVCNTDLRLRGLGTDHVPVLTTLEFEIPERTKEACRNFRATDWDKFREDLAEQLYDILGPCALLTDSQFQRAVAALTQMIQATIEAMVLIPRPSLHSCCWWS